MESAIEAQIIEAYCGGLVIREIVRRFECSDKKLYQILKLSNVESRKSVEWRLRRQSLDECAVRYKNGESLHSLEKWFKIRYQTIRRAIVDAGLEIVSARDLTTKYDVDESFFEIIDTEEKAYVLGFISADGCVFKGSSNTIFITVQERDRDVLEKIKKAMESEHPIKNRLAKHKWKGIVKTSRVCSLTIHSLHLVNQLIALGVTPKKSLTLCACEKVVGGEFERHYWRGVFDGDGSIVHVKTDRINEWELSLAGTKGIVSTFLDFVLRQEISTKASVRPVKSIYVVAFGGSRLAESVARLLYDNSGIFLSRKSEKARLLIEDAPTHKTGLRLLSEDDLKTIKKLHSQGHGCDYIAKLFPISRNTVWRMMRSPVESAC